MNIQKLYSYPLFRIGPEDVIVEEDIGRPPFGLVETRQRRNFVATFTFE